MDKLETITQTLQNWRLDRPTLTENERVADLVTNVVEEAYELSHALIDCMSTFDLDSLIEEVSDVIIYALNIFNLLKVDAFEAIMEKIAINSIRYPAGQFQNGDPQVAVRRLKKRGIEIKQEIYENTKRKN
jgi:NTP pyrophosphatase (non-canonical NTP hydrolase)